MSIFSVMIETYKYKIVRSKRENVRLSFATTINKYVKFEGANRIGRKCELRNVSLGFASYIGNRTNLYDAKVGKYCSIGDDVDCIVGKHPTNEMISTHPAFYSTRGQAGVTYSEKNDFEEYTKIEDDYSFVIGNDVWIGSHVKLLEGVKIGDGAIIACGSIVTRNVKPYEIVGGVPARHIKYRFSMENIELLDKIQWWDESENNLKEITHLMKVPEEYFAFMQRKIGERNG